MYSPMYSQIQERPTQRKPREIWLFRKILVKFPTMLPVLRSNTPPEEEEVCTENSNVKDNLQQNEKNTDVKPFLSV